MSDLKNSLSSLPRLSEPPICAGHQNIFFSEEKRDVNKAIALCGDCPIQQSCQENAIKRNEQYGVWGGLSSEEIRFYSRKLARQRRAAKKSNQATIKPLVIEPTLF